jgi:uncharacterized protein (TIGR02246 family)
MNGQLPAQSTGGKAALGKGERAKEFIAAFERGDHKAVAAFWTPEGTYVDQVGREYKGHAAIEKLYQRLFAEGKKKLNVIVLSARMVGTDVALEDGITEVTPAEGGLPTVGRFSAVLVRKGGTWYFESVHESVARPPSHVAQFEDIDWLIGDWTGVAGKGETATASYSWAENQNFIVSTFTTNLHGAPVVGGTQWIAWDAVDKRIRSWSFYSGGGFGEAVWSQDGSKWTIKTTARSADGKKLSATNILTKVDGDHATWQLTHLTVDGRTMPDPQPQKLTRVRPNQK